MPEPTKIPRPFADSGDKNTIPESSGALGFASWQEGFPAITGTPFAQGGVAPKRADFNGIFNALSLATVWQQQGGFYEYDAATDYEPGNVVEYNNELYKCITANGPSSAVKAPTDATVWSKVMTAADVAALYLPLSGGTMTGTLFGGGASGDWYISMTHNTAIMHLRGGTSVSNCASLHLYGDSQPNNPSLFSLMASRNGVSCSLQGRPDGTLTWGGKDVATNETGTWTPILAGETTTGALTYSTRTGVYVKLGRFVAITGHVVVDAITTQPEGYCVISGLPYVLSGPAVIPIRGLRGQNNCARKVIHMVQNSSGSSVLRIQGVNPRSIASTGQLEILRWSTSDSGADCLMFATSAPRMEIDICGCYLTTA